jgi:predicted  nucleic acid-binding Zn-ribbon protein
MEDRVIALEAEIDILNMKLLQLAWKIDDLEKRSLKEPSDAKESSDTKVLSDSRNPSNDAEVEIYDLRGKLVSVEGELSEIRTRIGVINKLISSNEEPDRNLPSTNIVSHSLWNRILGNIILITWIIAIVIVLFQGI